MSLRLYLEVQGGPNKSSPGERILFIYKLNTRNVFKKNYDELLIRITYRRITYSNKNNCLFGYMPIADVGNVHHSFLDTFEL